MGFYIYLTAMLAATLLLIFATTFTSAGAHLMCGLDVKGLGWLCLIWGIADIIYAGYFAMVKMPIFAVLCVCWFIVFMLFTGWCLICAFATLLIPCLILVTGTVFV